MSIEEKLAELSRQRQERRAKNTQFVLDRKKEIEKQIGRDYCGDYTYREALAYIVRKYQTQEITFEESLEYIKPELKHEVLRQTGDDPVWYLTEGYANGDTLKNILLLPPRGSSANDGYQKDGYILYLCEEDGKLAQWSMEGNTRGYYALETELYILQNSLKHALELAKS